MSFSTTAFDETNAFAGTAFQFGAVGANTVRAGWYSLADVLHEAEFLQLMRNEANGAAVWCNWSAGVNLVTDPVPKNNGNLDLNFNHFRVAATGATAWARFAPGTSSKVRGDIQVDMQAAETAGFAL